MAIEPSEVRHIAALAGLDIEEAAIAPLARELGTILEYVRALESLDDAAPRAAEPVAEPATPLREDVAREGAGSAGALANAADSAFGHFRVPRVLRE